MQKLLKLVFAVFVICFSVTVTFTSCNNVNPPVTDKTDDDLTDNSEDDDIFSTPQKALQSITYSVELDDTTPANRSVIDPKSIKYNQDVFLGTGDATTYAALLKTNFSTIENLEYGKMAPLKNFKINPEYFDSYLKAQIENQGMMTLLVLEYSEFKNMFITKVNAKTVNVKLYSIITVPAEDGNVSIPTVFDLTLRSDQKNRVSSKIYFYSNQTGSGGMLNEDKTDIVCDVYEYEEINKTDDGTEAYAKYAQDDYVRYARVKTIDDVIYSCEKLPVDEDSPDYYYGEYQGLSESTYWNKSSYKNDNVIISSNDYGYIYLSGNYTVPALNFKGILESNSEDIFTDEDSWDDASLTIKIGDSAPVSIKEYFNANTDNGKFKVYAKNINEDYFTVKPEVQTIVDTVKQQIPAESFWTSFASDIEAFKVPEEEKKRQEVTAWLKSIIE